jgi:hypothetical protein
MIIELEDGIKLRSDDLPIIRARLAKLQLLLL